MTVRIRAERERRGFLVRAFNDRGEVAYLSFRLEGLCAEVEFPSDWHEQPRAWVRLGFGFMRLSFSFPWSHVVPDEGQCSGPTYGFLFFEDGLHLHWGKSKGRHDDPFTVVPIPWSWRHIKHTVDPEVTDHPYSYRLRSGEVQRCVATINAESRTWWRPWIPWYRTRRYINVDFSTEVGEKSGSWKGGVLSCGYDMRCGESPLDTLRRMERERTFE